jgi:hypothetical protein
MKSINDAPPELADGIREFFPEEEWDNAASISFLESNWNAFAVNDTTDLLHPCGSYLRTDNGIRITAERSVGYFQDNSCEYPDWEWQRLYNARHNVGTAHLIWTEGGWARWYYSAKALGLIP